jgi:uncharacterized Zn finger protein (UPF0148 family)
MENNEPPKLSFAERMKQKAISQKNYGEDFETGKKDAGISVTDCPNCGAGRAKADGLTHCAYCGFEFISTPLSDGIFIKKDK